MSQPRKRNAESVGKVRVPAVVVDKGVHPLSSQTNGQGMGQMEHEYLTHFSRLVSSVGVKRFAKELDLSTRQINRMLSGAQPNPVDRLISSLAASEAEVGDQVLDFICQEVGGHFVRTEAIDEAAVNAVKECAEAIAAISDGHVSEMDLQEVREAISALSAILIALGQAKIAPNAHPSANGTPGVSVPPSPNATR